MLKEVWGKSVEQTIYNPKEDAKYFRKVLKDNRFECKYVYEGNGYLYRFICDFIPTLMANYPPSSISIHTFKYKAINKALINVPDYQYRTIEANIAIIENFPVRFSDFGEIKYLHYHRFNNISFHHFKGYDFSNNDFKKFIEAISNRIYK